MDLTQKIEAYLYYKAEDVSISEIAKAFSSSDYEVKIALEELNKRLDGHGLTLFLNTNFVSIRTHKDMNDFFVLQGKNELEEKLTPSAEEVLSIILYLGEAKKAHIDFIRGVNSSVSIRNLIARGLVDKNNKNEYFVTSEALSYMGISSLKEIKDYDEVSIKLKDFLSEMI